MTLATLLQILGAALATVGVGLASIPLALIVAGLFCLLFGLAMERSDS